MLPRAILIDLDDTLLDDSSTTESCWADAFAGVAERFGDLTQETVLAGIREQSSWFWSDAERHRAGRLDLRVATTTVIERAFEGLALADKALAREMANAYRDLREERADLFPGTLDALERLRGEGVRLGMMTNGAADAQRAKIDRFGLEPYFDHIVIEGEFGTGKPDRRVFDALLAKLEVDAAEAWAIGDNLEFDVFAPMQLGIHGIWIDPRDKGCDGDQPSRIVAAFAEIVS